MDDEYLPEDILYNFLLANLTGSEEEIRPFIVDHPDADVLWEGAYPPDVAQALAEQYEGMGISRLEEGPDRVLMQTSVTPVPLAVVRVDGHWRVDASPIIAFRKRT